MRDLLVDLAIMAVHVHRISILQAGICNTHKISHPCGMMAPSLFIGSRVNRYLHILVVSDFLQNLNPTTSSLSGQASFYFYCVAGIVKLYAVCDYLVLHGSLVITFTCFKLKKYSQKIHHVKYYDRRWK